MGGTRCASKIKQESEKRTPRVSADREASDAMVASRFSQFLQRGRNMELLRLGEKRARSGSARSEGPVKRLKEEEAAQEGPVKRLKEEEAAQE